MASGRVVQLSRDQLPSLALRLKRYGAFSVQTRAILHLLQARLNPAPFQVLCGGADGDRDLVAVTVLRPIPGFAVVDVCAPETSAGRRKLTDVLQAEELEHLWRGPFRVEAVAEGLAREVWSAASERGLKRFIDNADLQRLFVLPEGGDRPPRAESPRFVIRTLQPRHMTRVRSRWPMSHTLPDADVILRDCLPPGLAVGAFQAAPSGAVDFPADEPVSWTLLSSFGAQAAGYTELGFRRLGLQKCLLSELSRRTISLGLPVFLHTADNNVSANKIARWLGCTPQHVVQWLTFEQPQH